MRVVSPADSEARDIGSAGDTREKYGAAQMYRFITCRQVLTVARFV